MGATEGRTVVAAIFMSESEAVIAQGALEEAGIRSVLNRDDAGGAAPHFRLWSGIRLMVRGEDLARAKSILAEAGDSG